MYRKLFILCGLAAAAPSQDLTPAQIAGTLEAYNYTAVQKRRSDPMATILVDEHIVRVPGRSWLHMELANVRLAHGSSLEFTALKDGAKQTMRRDNRRSETAYFNGDAVRVRLFAGPGTAGNCYTITRIGVASPDGGVGPMSGGNCLGADSRVPSDDRRVCRIMKKLGNGKIEMLGTGFLVSPWNCIATAGHLFPTTNTAQVQFNVPPSAINGKFNMAAPEDQYLWNSNQKQIFDNGNPGGDWALFTVFPNDQTGKYPGEAQGSFFTLATQSINWDKIATCGYGRDTQPTRQHTQQVSVGKITSTGSSACWHTCYTEPGNSGGPLYDRDTGHAVAIHFGCVGNKRAATLVSNTSFQNAFATLSQAPQVADLVAKSMSTSIVTSMIPGRTYTFQSSVKNEGNKASTQVSSGYMLSTDTVLSSGDRLLHTFTTPALAKGATRNHSANVQIPINSGRGYFYPAVHFDKDYELAELEKDNNWRVGTRVFSTGLPDFRVDDLTANQFLLEPGKKVEMSAEFINVGSSSSGWTRHGFFLSGNATIEAEQDTLLAFFWTAPLAQAARVTSTRTVTIPNVQLNGQVYLGVYADYLKLADETKENNNTRSKTAWFDPPPCPDLQAMELTSPTEFAPNQTIEVRSMVQNNGNLAAVLSRTQYLLSKDAQPSQDDRLLAEFDTPALGQFAFDRDTRDVQIPGDVVPGTFYLLLVADVDADNTECNENNNVRSLKVTCVGRADLVVTGVTLPNAATAGDLISMTVKVRNVGSAASTPTQTGCFLSIDEAVTMDDTYLASYVVPQLAPGKQHDVVLKLALPYATPKGIAYLGAIADVQQELDEVHEGNNTSSAKMTVSAYAGSGRYLEWSGAKLDNTKGPFNTKSALVYPALSAASAKLALVAPQHTGKIYVCVLSQSQAAFQFDKWTDLGLSLLNTPAFPSWLGLVPANGIANPGISLPKFSLDQTLMLGIHALFLDGQNFDGFADNALLLELRKRPL